MELIARLAKFVPLRIEADTSALPASERTALHHLIEAARLMHPIFLRQAWEANPSREAELTGTARELFAIHAGPWDRTDSEPFVGDRPRPAGAGFYPSDLTAAEFEAYVAARPEQKEALAGLLTVVRRKAGALVAVPYSRCYSEWLEPARAHLLAAAAATRNETLARFVRSRAEAFASDDYYQSDVDWMDQDSLVEITIGPYETYEDRLLGYKAAFTAFVTVADPEESRKLALFKSELPGMEANLPIPDAMKNAQRGTDSPIRVGDVVFTAGHARAGVQTIAFNLPNDERVREAKGSKKVLLRNVIQAKYEGILARIAERLISAEQVELVQADAFSDSVLSHELAHGLGPGRISVGGRDTEVRLELKELYSPFEEVKADILGQYDLIYMMDKGLLPKGRARSFAVTWLASLFRSIRFGTESAHGKANAAQLEYALADGAVRRHADGRYSVDFARFPKLARELSREVCMLQARGDYAGTRAFLERYGELSATTRADLGRLADIPVDIRPIYAPDGVAG